MKKLVSLLKLLYSDDIIKSSIISFFINSNKFVTKNKILIRYINNYPECEAKISELLSNNHLNLNNIIDIFELLLENKKVNGVFYTPDFIIDYINDYVIEKNNNFTICDCSCGSGSFLISACRKIANKSIIHTIENNIYGADILNDNIENTKIVLSLLALQNNEDSENIGFNLKCCNSLIFDWRNEFKNVFDNNGFDGIIGNPPYVKIQNFDKDLKPVLIQKYKTLEKGNCNLYYAFFELGLSLLNPKGKMGYITPNNYFTSLSGQQLRKLLNDNGYIDKIIDFKHIRMFKDTANYTAITLLTKSNKPEIDYALIDNIFSFKNGNMSFKKIKNTDINNGKWKMLCDNDLYNIRKIENIGIPLSKMAKIRVGIMTLKDSLYILNGNEINGYYIKEYNKKQYYIEKDITKKIVKVADINNEQDLIKNTQRIIFPYNNQNGKNKIINEEELKTLYPRAYDYLLAIKNELGLRDKGKKIKVWYAYGREQGLNVTGKKLLIKTLNAKPNFVLDNDDDSLFYNGYAVFLKEDISILNRILNSEIMEYYMKKTSAKNGCGYYCYHKNYIASFSVPIFNETEKRFIISANKEELLSFLVRKYDLIDFAV